MVSYGAWTNLTCGQRITSQIGYPIKDKIKTNSNLVAFKNVMKRGEMDVLEDILRKKKGPTFF